MKALIYQFKEKAVIIVATMVVTLLFFSSWLYQQNRTYRQQNRELVVQNDSILAENIGLRQALEKVQVTAPARSSLSFKVRQ